MAKWGEGDPRWIVEERPDAKNVNNWHWTEKKADDWGKSKLETYLVGLKTDEPGLGTLEIKELKECNGEAFVHSRKGRILYFYDWVLFLNWEAKSYVEPDTKIEGVINIDNFSEEIDAKDLDVRVTVTSGGSEGQKFREYANKKFSQLVIDRLVQYSKDFKASSGTGILLPTKEDGSNCVTTVKSGSAEATKNFKELQKQAPSVTSQTGVKFNTTTVTLKETFKCRIDELYNVLTTPELVSAFTRRQAQFTAEAGSPYSLLDGTITGKFLHLDRPKQIKQTWRRRDWIKDHFSEVTINLSETEDSTKLELVQTGVPASDVDSVKHGWNNYYWESIKRTFGFSSINSFFL